MAAPKFRLEVVLKLRRRREEECQIALAEARRRLDAERQALAELSARREATLARQREEQAAARLDVESLELIHSYLVLLASRVAEQSRAVEHALAACEEAQAVLLEARREVKALEKLEAAWRENLRREELRAEGKLLDEFAITGHLRR